MSSDVNPSSATGGMAVGDQRSRPATTVLIIRSAPDDRESTANLRALIVRLRSRPGVRVEWWYLRDYHRRGEPHARVVDRLRTWAPAWVLERVGLSRLAGGLRGRRLRSWLNAVDPDLVLLDDGLGARVLDGWNGDPAVVSRLNPEPPPFASLEGDPLASPDAYLVNSRLVPATSDPTIRVISEGLEELDYVIDALAEPVLAETRSRLGIPSQAHVVVGWGSDDAWIDGADLFLRTIWALEYYHQREVVGLWLAEPGEPLDEDRLDAEAERLGIAERIIHTQDLTVGARGLADAVFLPHRAEETGDFVDVLVGAQIPVVRFDLGADAAEGIEQVAFLDVRAAAERLDAHLGRAPTSGATIADRLAESYRRDNADLTVRELLALARGER